MFKIVYLLFVTAVAVIPFAQFILLTWVAWPWGWVTLFFIQQATHYDTLYLAQKKAVDNHHDYLLLH